MSLTNAAESIAPDWRWFDAAGSAVGALHDDAAAVRALPHLQVLGAVVGSHAVDVMHGLAWQERTLEEFGHHQAVFHDEPVVSGHAFVPRIGSSERDAYVAVWVDGSSAAPRQTDRPYLAAILAHDEGDRGNADVEFSRDVFDQHCPGFVLLDDPGAVVWRQPSRARAFSDRPPTGRHASTTQKFFDAGNVDSVLYGELIEGHSSQSVGDERIEIANLGDLGVAAADGISVETSAGLRMSEAEEHASDDTRLSAVTGTPPRGRAGLCMDALSLGDKETTKAKPDHVLHSRMTHAVYVTQYEKTHKVVYS